MDLIELATRCHSVFPRIQGEYLAWVEKLHNGGIISAEEYEFMFRQTKEVDLYDVCDVYAVGGRILQEV